MADRRALQVAEQGSVTKLAQDRPSVDPVEDTARKHKSLRLNNL